MSMAADNHTTIVGNLVEDPSCASPKRHRCGDMRVAVTQRIQQDGQWREGDTSFLKAGTSTTRRRLIECG
jgi:single-stranded DNA-binding protein